MTFTNFDINQACIGPHLSEGACERLEQQFQRGEMRLIDSAGYPPIDYPLNRGDWFSVEDLLEALDGSCYLRQQEIYTGTMHSSHDPVYYEVELIDERDFE